MNKAAVHHSSQLVTVCALLMGGTVGLIGGIAGPAAAEAAGTPLAATSVAVLPTAVAESPIATTTTLTVVPSRRLEVGSLVTLTATISPAATGTVVFRDSGHELGSAALQDGVAVLATKAIFGGKQLVVAEFAGSPTHSLSTSMGVRVAIRDRIKPTLGAVTISGTAAAPVVSWSAGDVGGLKVAIARGMPNPAGARKWSTDAWLAADQLSWRAPGVAARTRWCVELKVLDWAGNASRTRSKCRVLN
ncbi:MAG: Ig-like domain-containing protein [Candidatus Nanopelagicales bacterium]